MKGFAIGKQGRPPPALPAQIFHNPRQQEGHDILMTMKRFLCTLACLLVLAGTACSRDTYVRGIGGDIRWMDVPQGQLKTKIYGTGSHSENPVLVVVLHGDGGKGPPPSYQYAVAQAIAEGFDKPELSEGLRQSMGPLLRFDDVVAAGILRPGYTDPDGDQSDGRMGTRTGDNHTREVTEAVVAVVNTLKKELNARAVILMGHSGGATISANILALYPDTADAALLVVAAATWRQPGRAIMTGPATRSGAPPPPVLIP